MSSGDLRPPRPGMDGDTGDRAPHTAGVVSVTKEAGSTTTTRKRPYERDEFEADREMDKMFRCNYWEDPAYAFRLQRCGLLLARFAALRQFSERVNRATDAWEARAATADR